MCQGECVTVLGGEGVSVRVSVCHCVRVSVSVCQCVSVSVTA